MLTGLTSGISNALRSISGRSHITDKNIADTIEAIKESLIDADVNLKVVRRFVARTTRDATGVSVLKSVSPGQQFTKIVQDRLTELLGSEKADLALRGPDVTSVVLLAGLQGSGKTTTAAKLAARLKSEGRRPILIAADRVRPAAVQQLEQLGERVGVPVFTGETTASAVEVCSAGVSYAQAQQRDVAILDTAGRLHADEELLGELKTIVANTRPTARILVADSMTGQSAAALARSFHESVDLTGVVLTKFDSDTRGGAALSIKTVSGAPILFVGTGEGTDALEPFHPERIASRILGMGDVVSLVERAQQTIDERDAQKLRSKMASATFTLADYLDQLRRLRKMGSTKELLQMIPGMASLDDASLDQRAFAREEAIILSMTPHERANFRIIGASRRKRIASGSGTSVFDVNQMIKRFDKMRGMMRKATRNPAKLARVGAGAGGRTSR